MTAAVHLSSVNCTQCGAGLSVLGGGRVLSHVCGYCGAVLDTQNAYKVIDSIGKRDHPASPVNIGMTLTAQGAEFTVIGTIGMLETWGGRTWNWVEHQLFSPTHGYAWLSHEDGNFTFTRKIRDFPMRHWLSSRQVEASETPPHRSFRGETYRYFETTTAKIDFMEGEFNWRPRLDDATTTVTLLGPNAMLGLVDGPTEREVELTTLLPRNAAMADLGIPVGTAQPPRYHALTPYRQLPEEGAMKRAFGVTTVLALLLALAFSIASGSAVLQQTRIPVSALPQTYSFTITDTARLASVTFRSDVQNAWAVFSAEITGPGGAPILAGSRATERYSGVDQGERWSEGNGYGDFRFRPTQTGPHTVTVALEETGTDGIRPQNAQAVDLTVRQGVGSGFWMLVCAGVFALAWAAIHARAAMHRKRRFAGSDWTDED